MITRFSIRSLLLCSSSAAVSFVLVKILALFFAYLAHVCLFGVVAASLGYDFEPTYAGIVLGLSWGLLIGALLSLFVLLAHLYVPTLI